jgi:hypothetical protein
VIDPGDGLAELPGERALFGVTREKMSTGKRKKKRGMRGKAENTVS